QRQAAEAMQAAIARQRAAIRTQLGEAAAEEDSFFVIPWRQPVVEAAFQAQEQPPCEPVPEEELGPLVEQIAEREGLTPDLLRAVIEKESSRLPCAVSQEGAQGLMQLMPSTAAELGVSDPFDPAENVSAGAGLLRRLLARYGGDLALALGAYNAGPAWIDAFGALPPFRETLDYVSAILGRLEGERGQQRRPR
ncbi:MAG: lytic transglycosylase domain-containing protein, partial [Bryobacteraceae bacterium]